MEETEKLSDMQKLAQAQAKVAALNKELKHWKDEEKKCLGNVLEKATFSEDAFLGAIGKKGDSYREGDYKLLRQPTDTRSIRVAEFSNAFPTVFYLICTVPVQKAELLVKPEILESYCNHKITYRYKTVDMRVP